MYFYDDDTQGFIEDNNIKFIRMSFSDILGNMKNIAIMPGELTRAIEYGIPFYTADVLEKKPSTLMLRPDTDSLSVLPWRPQTGRVVRFFCNIFNKDGTPYAGDLRRNLGLTVSKLKEMGLQCKISTRCEFYLFKTDVDGNPTKIPFDDGGYLDIAPLDKCENARREICLSLEEMGLNPISSCHKSGPGQNEIDFASSDPLTAADNMMHYKAVVKTIAASNGLYASFMPKPLPDEIGSALKIYISITRDGKPLLGGNCPEGMAFAAGIKKYLPEFALFMNSTENSYQRLDAMKKDGTLHVMENIEIPGCDPELEIRSADACCNPYLTMQLLLEAGMDGMKKGLMFNENEEPALPETLEEAMKLTSESEFISRCVPAVCTENFLRRKNMKNN